MTKALQLAVATVGLLLVLLLLTGAVSLANAHAALAKGKWSFTGSMKVARYNHTATLLKNGKVLVAGGDDSAGCMRVSFASGTASQEMIKPTRSLCFCRDSIKSAQLSNENVGT